MSEPNDISIRVQAKREEWWWGAVCKTLRVWVRAPLKVTQLGFREFELPNDCFLCERSDKKGFAPSLIRG